MQAVIYYTVTVILTKELLTATDQYIEYLFKSSFFPSVSCEDIYNKNPESHEWSGYILLVGLQWILRAAYITSDIGCIKNCFNVRIYYNFDKL